MSEIRDIYQEKRNKMMIESDKCINELISILNKYYPIEDFSEIESILSLDDYERYNELVSKINGIDEELSIIYGSRNLENLQYSMNTRIPKENAFDSYDDRDNRAITFNKAKKAIDVYFFALESENILQLIKCLDFINECLLYLGVDTKLSHELRVYMNSKLKSSKETSQSGLNYSIVDNSWDYLCWIGNDIVDKRTENIKSKIEELRKKTITDKTEKNIKQLQQEIIELEKSFYGKSNYEQQLKIEQQITKQYKFNVSLSPEKQQELNEFIQSEINNEILSIQQSNKEENKLENNNQIIKEENNKTVSNNNLAKQFSQQQLDDIEEWKKVIYGWQDTLSIAISESNLQHNIIENIKSGKYSLDELEKVIPEEEQLLFENLRDIYYKGYLSIIEEFKEWTQNNNINISFEDLLNEMKQEKNNKDQSNSIRR